MELAGKISDNLAAAIKSAQRLRGHPVHPDTLAYWNELLAYARERQRHPELDDDRGTPALIAKLQAEVAER